MDNFAIDVAAAPSLGAACSGVPSPWATSVATGANYALAWNFVLAAGVEGTRSEAMAHRGSVSPKARLMGIAPVTPEQLAGKRAGGRAAELLPAVAILTSKPKQHVQKTRINAGGYGAMGPHLQRERLALPGQL